MKNDDNFQKVVDNFITPLSKIFNKNLNEAQIEAFVEDLSRFTKPELLGSQLIIRRKNKYFPIISEAINACESLREREQRDSRSFSKNPYQESDKNRQKLIAEYLVKFKASSLWFQAASEGWGLELWRYVYAVADVQAQMVLGMKNIGWSLIDIFGVNYQLTTDGEKAVWFKTQREQSGYLGIDVAVPAGRISEWKADAEREKERKERLRQPKAGQAAA